MYYKFLLDISEIHWYYYLLVALGILFIAYIILVIVSFSFMNSFKKKIKHIEEAISIDFYQMKDCLMKLNDLFKDSIDAKTYEKFIKSYGSNEFNSISKDNVSSIFNKLELSKKELERIFVNNVENYDKEKVMMLFSSFKEISEHYTEMTQAYETYVIGFNYWRNLFSTKWIKKLFRIKEITGLN